MASLTRRFALAASALSLLVLVMSAVASAAITVTNTNDTGAGSLRAAITSANSSPTVATTINFSVSGTITLGSALPAIANSSPNGSLTIDGSGQSITVDGASTFQILTVNSGATLTVENLTMSDGSATLGGGIENEGTLTVSNCTFSGDIGTDGGDGGAIYNTGILSVTNSTFSGNSAGSGGALDNHATSTITNSTFSGNSAPMGAGGAIRNVGSLKLTNSTFSGNSADVAGLGGAIDNANGAAMTIANSTFSGNSVSGEDQFGHTGHGGAIENFGSATLSGVILAASTGGGNCDNVFPGSKLPTSAGFNISDDSSCGFSGTSINSSTTLNLDPRGLRTTVARRRPSRSKQGAMRSISFRPQLASTLTASRLLWTSAAFHARARAKPNAVAAHTSFRHPSLSPSPTPMTAARVVLGRQSWTRMPIPTTTRSLISA